MVNVSRSGESCPYCPIPCHLPAHDRSGFDLLQGIPEEHCKHNDLKVHETLQSVFLRPLVITQYILLRATLQKNFKGS